LTAASALLAVAAPIEAIPSVGVGVNHRRLQMPSGFGMNASALTFSPI
jgi:hypothetical protein